MKELEHIRKTINTYDEEIIETLSLRFEAVKKVAQIKKENSIPIFDRKREEEIIKSIQLREMVHVSEIAEIYKEIMKESRKYQSKMLLPKKLFLTGFMGAGKSTTGKLLSEITGFKFTDTDLIIEEMTQMKVPDIFRKKGEKHFRQLETEVLNKISKETYEIIACGGGIILKEENRKKLKNNGKTIFLNGSIEVMMERIQDDSNRPLTIPLHNINPQKKHEAFKDILNKRMPFYLESADFIIDIDNKKPEEIADEILTMLITES